MKLAKKPESSDLVIRMMNELVAHDYLEEGAWTFLNYLLPKEGSMVSGMNRFVLAAEMEDQVVGTIEVGENNHIILFFVEKKYRQRGIGRKLLQRAVELCVKQNPQLSECTVNSLPSSVHIYKKLGFHVEKQEGRGGAIAGVPMFMGLSKLKNWETYATDSTNTIKASPLWSSARMKDGPTYVSYDG